MRGDLAEFRRLGSFKAAFVLEVLEAYGVGTLVVSDTGGLLPGRDLGAGGLRLIPCLPTPLQSHAFLVACRERMGGSRGEQPQPAACTSAPQPLRGSASSLPVDGVWLWRQAVRLVVLIRFFLCLQMWSGCGIPPTTCSATRRQTGSSPQTASRTL